MKTKIYLLAIIALLCVSCKGKQADTSVQPVIETALLEQLKAVNADKGGVLLMDVNTGNLIAKSHFEQSDESEWKEASEFLLNEKAEQGSLFKTASMLVALNDNVVSPNDLINTEMGSVTKIGKSAFYGCKELTSIAIPNSVTEIGGNAFRDRKSVV